MSGSSPSPTRGTGGRSHEVTLDIEVAEGTLRFLDPSGAPLADTEVQARFDHPHVTRRTDAEGRATFRLAAGGYFLVHGPERTSTTAWFAWSATGPTASDVRF